MRVVRPDDTLRGKQRQGLPRPKTALYATGKLYESIKERVLSSFRGGR